MADALLEYLTVFRARLGAVNIVLGLTALSHIPEETLVRNVKKILNARTPLTLDDAKNDTIFEYLKDKGLIPDNHASTGRYEGYALRKQQTSWRALDKRGNILDELPVFRTDIWMANPLIRSTIGVPTPDNAKEIIDLAFQLRLLSRGKTTWTAAGYLIERLRTHDWGAANPNNADNPFLLGIEAPAILRQVVELDGFLLRELLRSVISLSEERAGIVSRDDVSKCFSDIVSRAVESLSKHCSSTVLLKAKQFRKQIEQTSRRNSARTKGPGVLEHRVSPRLEWLVDFGYLSKEGLPKNGFTYRFESPARSLLADLDAFAGSEHWAEKVALSQWATNPIWESWRLVASVSELTTALFKAYELLRRPIGPLPLNDIVFVSSMLLRGRVGYSEVQTRIVDFAQENKGVTLSGSRLHRGPQNIYIPDKLLEKTR